MTETPGEQNKPDYKIFNLTCPNNEIITGGVIETGMSINSITSLKCGGKSVNFEKQGDSSQPYILPTCNKGYDELQYVVTVDSAGNEIGVNGVRFKCRGEDFLSGQYGKDNVTSKTKNLKVKKFTCPAGSSIIRLKGNYQSGEGSAGIWTSLNLDESDCLLDSNNNATRLSSVVDNTINTSSTTTTTTTATTTTINPNYLMLVVIGIAIILLMIMLF